MSRVVSRDVPLPGAAVKTEGAVVGTNVQNNRVTLDTINNPSASDSRGHEEGVTEMKDNAIAAASTPVPPDSVKSNKNLSENDKNSLVFPKEFQFPWKLYEMLQRSDENNFSHLVSWMPGNLCFKVHDVDNFVLNVMPSYFKQTKYKSFQRQLNLYGFIRVDSGPSKGGYRHASFIRGHKDLLTSIIRIKIKGNGKRRCEKFGIITIDGRVCINSGDNPNSVGKNNNIAPTTILQSSKDNQAQSTSSSKDIGMCKENPAAPLTSVVPTSPEGSGIEAILEAIKARERKDSQHSAAVQSRRDCVHNVAESSSSSSTIPSTIEVKMKDTEDAKNSYGLSWRQHPSESYSDWTIEVISEDISLPINEHGLYYVHRRVLAVGPKKSDYFANIFKLNDSANRNQLRLSRRQAAVFPMALDYIYADVDFDLNPGKAYALYSLGEKLGNEAILQGVTDYYSKRCMTKDCVVECIKLGQSFKNKMLLETAVIKCSEEIWSIDVEIAAKIDPGVLYHVLILVLAQDQDTVKSNSVHLSQIVATCVSNATRITLTPEIFRSLTDKSLVPSIDPIAAIKLLATENTLLSGIHGSPSAGDPSLHERCVFAIHRNWDSLRRRFAENRELANTMRSISSIVLFDILMKTTDPEVHSD